jgi:hypothetical protein
MIAWWTVKLESLVAAVAVMPRFTQRRWRLLISPVFVSFAHPMLDMARMVLGTCFGCASLVYLAGLDGCQLRATVALQQLVQSVYLALLFAT